MLKYIVILLKTFGATIGCFAPYPAALGSTIRRVNEVSEYARAAYFNYMPLEVIFG